MNKKLKKHLGEGLLIVFSVLFALFINRLSENYQTSKEVKNAKKNIIQELEKNQRIIEKWKEKHIIAQGILNNFSKEEIDSLSKIDLIKPDLLIKESIANDLPSNTAWETAKTTGIISEFDFKLIQELTRTYDLQKILNEDTLKRITEHIFSYNFQDATKVDRTIHKLNLEYQELIGQEISLLTFYKEALSGVKNK